MFIGYHEPQSASTVVANVSNTSNKIDQTSVNDVIATGVAADVAQTANLPIATSVANLAVSAQTKSEFTQADGVSTTKPELVGTGSNGRSIISYTAKAGDTTDSVAAQFNISKETVKWANNLVSDAIPEGKVLKILPVSGVLYTVKASDTIDSIASKYNVDKTSLVLYNDLDVNGLQPNSTIILPSGVLPNNERPGYTAPAAVANYFYGAPGTGFGGGHTWFIAYGTPDNGLYAHGNCTLYAYNRRKALGLGVGDHWGNAGTWAANAAAEGYQVNHTPGAGAIMADWGHVAIVEQVLANGDLSISEMNAYVPGGGYNIVSGRIVPAGNAGYYWYIH